MSSFRRREGVSMKHNRRNNKDFNFDDYTKHDEHRYKRLNDLDNTEKTFGKYKKLNDDEENI
ncbi:hypothetical protein [Lake Baikal phage Baikal-20-5m-C28]|nr:hypothetical protein [Lake Baikal phage Baikal-20-5m-C28]